MFFEYKPNIFLQKHRPKKSIRNRRFGSYGGKNQGPPTKVERFSTIDLHVTTSSGQLVFILKRYFTSFIKQAVVMWRSTVLNPRPFQ